MADLKSQKPYHFDSRAIIGRYSIRVKLTEYLQTVLEYNRKVNIVSRETSFGQLLRIAADCLVPFEFLDPPSGRIFDIGSGAGFPAVVIQFAFPETTAVLVERRKKKAAFLNLLIRQFNLKAEVIDSDLKEAKSRIEPESFDYGFMKLVKLNRRLLSLARSLLKPTGRFIYFSSPDKITALSANKHPSDRFDYYLDDVKQLRTITIFSRPS